MNPVFSAALVASIHAQLPQTQCTRCGFADCLAYAEAIAVGDADINQCPPGGAEGVSRLSKLTHKPEKPLDPAFGQEGPRHLVWIDENWCIGCTLCIKACPVDAIIGANKRMHTVIEAACTGCDLCLPVCPVDCIKTELVPALPPAKPDATGWSAWSEAQADVALDRYTQRQQRLQREHLAKETAKASLLEHKLLDLASHSRITDPVSLNQKRSVVQQALEKARARLAQGQDPT